LLQLTLTSRSLRLAGISWCSYHTAGSDMARMIGTVVNKTKHGPAAAVPTGGLLKLMRSLIVAPMAVFNQ
jgi:hypothetical protein